MGIIKHEAVIVTGYEEDAEAILAFREQMPEEYRRLLVGSGEVMGIYYSFVFFPDGIKEGSQLDGEIDAIRCSFINLLASREGLSWAYVVLYDESVNPPLGDWYPRIVASSEAEWDDDESVKSTPNIRTVPVYRVEHPYIFAKMRLISSKKFALESAAIAYILAQVVEHGREWVRDSCLLRIMNQESGEDEQTELVAADDALFAYALQKGLASY